MSALNDALNDSPATTQWDSQSQPVGAGAAFQMQDLHGTEKPSPVPSQTQLESPSRGEEEEPLATLALRERSLSAQTSGCTPTTKEELPAPSGGQSCKGAQQL